MKKIIRNFIFFSLIVLTLSFCKTNAYAYKHLRKGKVFYDQYFTYKVTKAGTNKRMGNVQIMGFNPEFYSKISSDIYVVLDYNTVYYNVTGEKFYVKSVANGAFKNKDKIRSVGVKTYYYDSEGMGRYVRTISSIPKACFSGCKNLKSIEIADCNKNTFTINKDAFKGCSQLSTISISSVKKLTVKQNAFKGAMDITVTTRDSMPTTNRIKKYTKAIKKAGAQKVTYEYNYRTYTLK